MLPPRKIKTVADLPPAGVLGHSGQERAWLDFKEHLDRSAQHTMAKDIAAFANTFGGTILVGAKDSEDGPVYPGLSRSHAFALKEAFEQAAKDWCRPVPRVEPSTIELGGRADVLLAVNIEASIDLVAAQATVLSKNGDPCRNPGAWLFPVREGSHNRCLEAEELPMHYATKERATALRLLEISKAGGTLKVFSAPNIATVRGTFQPSAVLVPGGPPGLMEFGGTLRSVDVAQAVAVIEIRSSEGRGIGNATAHLPLRDVEAVWRSIGVWCVRVHGRIHVDRGAGDGYEPVL